MLDARKEEAFCTILREELQLATGCTEPIAVAYCAARLRQVLGERPRRILAEVSGNILKNVKSVVVPNTGGRRGLPAAIAVGVVAGDPEARLQVIAHVTEEDTAAIQAYLDSTDIRIDCPPTSRMLDIRLTGWAGDHKAVVHVANNHTNIIYVERDGEGLLDKPHSGSAEDNLQDKSVLNVRDILTFAETVDVSRIEESVGRQLECNTAIAREGLRGDWGANIGSTLLLFLAALARTLYLPRPENGRTLHAAALAAFCLCLCWELPRVLLLLAAGFGGGMAAVLPELLSGLALCCIGGMGLACIGQGKAGNN